jgi:hypothetical protein
MANKTGGFCEGREEVRSDARLFQQRHCERSEAIQGLSAAGFWIASSQGLLAMTVLNQ